MKEYQLYLENIINALSRVGISYQSKIKDYESLFYCSESLGSFLEINSFLQRVGLGVRVAGFDESITYKSYWNSEFYLEYQERSLNELSFRGSSEELVPLEDSLVGSEDVTLLSDVPEKVSNTVEEFKSFSSITGKSSDGFDLYGVDLEDYTEEGLAEEEITEESVDSPIKGSSNYSSISGISSDGFDVYGVDLEEELDEELNDNLDEEVEEDTCEVLGSDLSDGSSYLNEEVELFPDEEVPIVSSMSSEVTTSEKVNSDGFDLYGVELDYEDEAVFEGDSDSGYSEEDDPDNPDNFRGIDLVSEGYDDSIEFEEYEEEYDEENDPNNPDNSIVEDLVEDYDYSEFEEEEYDEENDPNNPEAGSYVDTVSSESYYQEDSYEDYDEENDPNNPENSIIVDNVSSVDYQEDYDEENDPNDPEFGNYSEDVSNEYQKPKVKPKPKVSDSYKEIDNLLNFMGGIEKKFLKKVRNNGKN